MPQIRYYRVTQTREVRVEAQDPLSAAHIAQASFDCKDEGVNQLESISFAGKATSQVQVKDLEIREDF